MAQRIRVAGLSMSLDGYAAGPNQSLADPIGQGGLPIFDWVFHTKCFRDMHGAPAPAGDDTGADSTTDNAYATRSMSGFGAFILGRNMFGPVRGPWPDESWKGWWGDNPPYHAPTFVLTHHPRAPIEMKGGTTFYFVTDGVQAALARARDAAGDKDVKIGGGVATIRQCLAIDAIDQMHLVVSPVILGRGESLLAGIDLAAKGFRVIEHATTQRVMHVVVERT